MSGEVAQELQMPMGPQMLEDGEEPMLARLATLRDRAGTAQSDTLSESTLVQDVGRIPKPRFTASRTVENRCSCNSTSA